MLSEKYVCGEKCEFYSRKDRRNECKIQMSVMFYVLRNSYIYYTYICTLDVVRISSCLQVFNYNPEYIEYMHLARIEPKTRCCRKPLSDPYTND